MVSYLALQSISASAYAQGGVEYGDAQVQSAFAKAVKAYDNIIGRNASVYSGIEYYSPQIGVGENPFFVDDYWELGSVVYDQSPFDSIELKYDIYYDQLIVENFGLDGHPAPILLYKPKVQSFQLHGYDFIRIDSDSLSNLKSGYYNLMYNGAAAKLLIKRRKEKVQFSDINSIREEFQENDKYFIEKGGNYYPVKKKKSVLRALDDKNKELKSFIKSNGLNFKSNPDEQLALVVEYYDSLF
jgi:hypothetical protein